MSFYMYLLNINLKIPNKTFCGRSAFEPGLLFLRERPFFRTWHSSYKIDKPLYQNVRIDRRIVFTFS